MAMTVLVCDSVPVVRDGLTSLLSEAPDVTRVSATGNAVECLVMTRKLKPDVLITDLSPEGMDGIDFVHRVIRENAQERDGRPGVVVFASDMTDRVIEKLLRAGAITLLEKETGREMLLTAVRAAARGEVMLAPHVTGRLVRWFRSREFGPDRAPDPQVESLTPREREILVLVGEGLPIEEIAAKLVIGSATVRTHIYRLRHKLNVRDRAQLVSFAHSAGLL
ncbi:LuxR C-terminal-related transcriptional regulator [Streptomyces sp. NPDC010273]|uniref:LuxR C-terminal-related transcriptional regulator n=1 Tax=Streptomyces sp. NPDC010273 TaxID=3364829 RepID=UPI0036E53796